MVPSDLETLERLFPVSLCRYPLKEGDVGLVIVDPGRGFTREGNLSDPTHMVPMIRRIASLYRELHATLGNHLQVLVFLDTHDPDIPEPPYPPHGIKGTGEELIDPELEFLLSEPNVRVIRKDCINGYVGAMYTDKQGEWSEYEGWVVENELYTILVCGDCTDICVSDFVLTTLSARNHGRFTLADPSEERDQYVHDITSMDIVVLADACETFDAPGHDREAAHHVGLWMMATRGAILASSWEMP
ncbi:isochorismatase family protein [Candidatus Uhrbacteria bacterium]|nr:isochorismatase family protein [Candidatus Uhrbacteria bacterium]